MRFPDVKELLNTKGILDSHFNKVQGKSLLDRLSYSKKEAELQIEPIHTIDIKDTKGYVSVYEGALSLYRVVELYFDYKTRNIY
ncbi:hypothetical protein [Lysinibacillus telephonicus]|uniref:Uncharacterized protein n=1 Tax=Lysinibacillus telephonicus TaxID=1714840 RepID=A0A431USY2_9BACI|nr:hypothetical protein [Lysinibacillus telephonicus]RTQ93696.1 hypothetical protein EKG35_08030 [Lysinibacillus telephonicus]